MPELPEVETIKNDLKIMVVGHKIKYVGIILPRIIKSDLEEFKSLLPGKKISEFERIGKIISVGFESWDVKLLFHLKMTGQLVYCSKSAVLAGGHGEEKDVKCVPGRHTRLEIGFSNKARLFFNDLRTFGYVKLVNGSELALIKKAYGPDPLDKDFNTDFLYEKIKQSKASIKSLLLNQRIIAGIGNIYADEILFASGIFPSRPGFSISRAEAKGLVKNSKIILKKAIKNRGTTFNDYVDANGRQGKYSGLLKVYGRAGYQCSVCKNMIKKRKVAGRGTHFCEKCQL